MPVNLNYATQTCLYAPIHTKYKPPGGTVPGGAHVAGFPAGMLQVTKSLT